ncbi:MAG: hypothetical protein NT020_07250 [Chloroflexales bacterium]|nr:hypothetical protein [Chloroflexales bacterium]
MEMQSPPVVAGISFTPLLIQQITISIVGAFALISVIVLFVRIRRRMALEKTRLRVQADADTALRGLRSRLNYAAQLLNNERDRMVYDRVRFSDAHAKEIAQHIHQAEQLFETTQTSLDRSIRLLSETPTTIEYEALIRTVQELTPTIPPIEATLQQSIKQRSELDSFIQKNSDLIEQVQRDQQKLSTRLTALGISHRELLASGNSALAYAYERLANHQYTDANSYAEQAQLTYRNIETNITKLIDVRNGIITGRQAAEKATDQGFDARKSLDLCQQGVHLLDLALAELIAGNLHDCEIFVIQAETLRQQAVSQGGSLPIIQKRQTEAIGQITREGETLTIQFEAAATAFQSIKNMHLSLWDDIVNAGSEAALFARFGAHYVAWANRINTPEQNTHVNQLLTQAQTAIKRADTILQIIIQRHDDAQQIELIARKEFADAEALHEIVQNRTNNGDRIIANHTLSITTEFLALQRASDEIPFDALSCFRKTRQFFKQTSKFLPHDAANTPLLIAERSKRIRDMLWRQMRMIEQFHILHPFPDGEILFQGLQSVRQEANTFDVALHTASDMTSPILSELTRLIQRYDRIDSSLSHITEQLREAWSNQIPREEALSGALQSVAKHIRATNDEPIRTVAIKRLIEIDNQYVTNKISLSKAITLIQTMNEALPNNNLGVQSHIIDPVPFLHMRRWAKIGPFAPPLQSLSWVPANMPSFVEW